VKRLTLMRHAKSSWKHPGLADEDRPLNKRGKSNAPEMGARLAARGFRPDRMVSSPAKRAWVTALAVAEQIGYPRGEIVEDQRIYGAGSRELIELLRELDDQLQHVMVFGHNPTFTEAAVRLTKAPIDNVPTSGVVDILFEIDSWRDLAEGRGKLQDFDFPKKQPD
jgi:phosphohistidine phosphatase